MAERNPAGHNSANNPARNGDGPQNVAGEDRVPELDMDTVDPVGPDEPDDLELEDFDPDESDPEVLDEADMNPEDLAREQLTEPDNYPSAAENDPENWRRDPLIEGEPGTGQESVPEQVLRDETAEERYLTGDEQVGPDEPTIGEAAADLDLDVPLDDDEADASDDPLHDGGRSVRDRSGDDPLT